MLNIASTFLLLMLALWNSHVYGPACASLPVNQMTTTFEVDLIADKAKARISTEHMREGLVWAWLRVAP